MSRCGLALREGKDLSGTLGERRLFPPVVISFLKSVAEGGTLAAAATRLANIYEAKLALAVRRIRMILEPLVILLVSALVGFIVLSIISAVMGVYELTGT